MAVGIDLVGDDTDLFTTNPNIAAQVPNVLFIVDNTSSWDSNSNGWNQGLDAACTSVGMPASGNPNIKQGDAEMCAIFIELQKLSPAVNVGFMMFNDQNKGSHVRFPMSSMTTANLTTLKNLAKGMDIGASANKVGSNSTYEDKMNDVFRYFNSLATFTANAAPAQADAGAYVDSSKNNFKFLSGQGGDTCGYDYVIFIGNNFPNSQSWTANPPAGGAADLVAAAALLNDPTNVNFGTNNANLVPLQNTGSNADVWAKFMFNYGVKVGTGAYRHITTYTVNVCPYSSTGADTCTGSQQTLMKSMASVSQGKYFPVSNLAGIQTALAQIFAEVQAVNSVFAATTLPVSINVRGTNLNQVYIGVFRPDSLASPRWLGNLKQYQLGVNATTGALQLVDALGVQAVNLNTGFISNSATSIWTTAYDADSSTPGTQGFWSFRSAAGFPSTDVGRDQDAPDGDLVEKGGAAERIRIKYPVPDQTTPTNMERNIYTCTGACATSVAAGTPYAVSGTPFNVANVNVTGTLLGTYQAFNVTSLTASGTTATASTSPLPHGFVTGNSVTIAGAVPNLFNGAFTITVPALPAGLTTFTYTLASGPDTTHAYVTQPGYALVPGTDLVTVSSASPSAYNVTSSAISAVAGNANQYSYVLASSPTSAASGYTVSGVRQIQTAACGPTPPAVPCTKVTWSNASSLNNVAVNLTNHGYSSGDTVAISGANETAFNTTGSVIIATSANQFTYTTASTPPGGNTTTGIATLTGALPSGWGNGTVVRVSGASGNFNSTASGSPISAVAGNTFQYTTTGTVSSSATGTLVANQVVASDASTWTVSSGALVTTSVNQGSTWSATAVTVSGSNLRFTLSQAKFTSGSSTALRPLVAGDSITIAGTSCSYRQSNTNKSCLGTYVIAGVAGNSALVASPSTTFQNFTGSVTMTVDIVFGSGITSSGGNAPAVSGATMAYSGSNSVASAIRFTLSRGQYSGQFLRQLAVSDTISFANCTFAAASSTACTGPVAAVSGNSSVTTSAVAANTYGDISGTVTVDITPSNISQATSVSTTNTSPGATPSGSATTIAWTGQTVGANVPISTITAGPLTVNASGLIYASKTGDLTSRVTSIANQSVATGTITAGLATVPDPLERDNLISWVRGQDNKDNENLNNVPTDVRASAHGDVLHSRPAVINYNRYGDNNDIYIIYGANDGMLHAIKGGQSTDGGDEQWTFIAPDHFGKLKRLRNQTPTISSTSPKDYFFDGPIGIYTTDADANGKLESGSSGDKVYLYPAMRRGGRMMYAFDVTNPTAPKLLWKKGCTQPTGTASCDTGWEQIGQTWSQPQVVYLRAYPTTPVLIFGAGYDPAAEDFQPCFVTAFSSTSVTGLTGVVPPTPMNTANCPPSGGTSSTGSRTMGRGIFIVNATTGAILWRAGPDVGANAVVTGMDYSIPADLAILRNRSNTAGRGTTAVENVPTGYMDRIYAPDTGGNVWRIDVADASTANWVVTKLAGISAASASSMTTTGSPAAANMRKFEFQPDVVYTSETDGTNFDAVLLGSGDREHPFDMVVANRFYMFKDLNIGTITPAMMTTPNTPPATLVEGDLFDVTNGCLQLASLCPSGVTQTAATTSLRNAKGWILKLDNVGEKTIASATTAAGSVIFNTNQPKQDTVTGTGQNVGANAANQCVSDLGTARQYGVSFQNGNSGDIFNSLPTQYVPSEGHGRFATFAGGGFLPTPVPVVVQIGGTYYQTVIAGVQTTNPGGLKLQSRLRSYWYRKTD